MKRSTKRKLIRNGTYVVTHANPRKGGVRTARRRNPLKSAIPGLPAWTMYAGGTAAAEGKHAYSFTAPDGRRYSISPFTTRHGRHAGYILTVFPSRTGGHGWIASDGSENAIGVGSHRSPQAAVSAARLHYAGGEHARVNPARYAVVHFRSPSDVTGKTISRHATLAAAQAAHAKIVLRNGKLIPDYQSYGIIDV